MLQKKSLANYHQVYCLARVDLLRSLYTWLSINPHCFLFLSHTHTHTHTHTQLLLRHGYTVTSPDQENQKPLDWADAMNEIVCVHYLTMVETCWQLSNEVAVLREQIHM